MRIGFLFAALCLIKLGLIIGLRKYLFEIHWRISGQPFNGLNAAAFYAFAALVGMNLWLFGRQCRSFGASSVRMANVCVLAVGAIFIFLTFHNGDKNYLAPVLNQILGWKDLGSYMSLNFFFQMPFLSVWIFVYAATYYVLVRRKREEQALMATAVFATAYVAICLRDLIIYHDALIVADCLGLACLLHASLVKRSPGLFPVSVLILAGGFFFALFYSLAPRLTVSGLAPEFSILAFGTLVLFAGVTLIMSRRGLWNHWAGLLPFAYGAFLLLITGNFVLASNYNNLLCLGFTTPRYFLGEFAICAVLFFLAIAYRRWRPGGSLWWLDGAIFVLIALALLDFQLSRVMEVRLDWSVLSLAMGETPRMMWRMARPYLPSVLAILLVVSGVYFAALRMIRRMMESAERNFASSWKPGAQFSLIAFVLLAAVGAGLMPFDKTVGESAVLLVQSSPLWKTAATPLMDQKTFAESANQLGMTTLLKPVSNTTTGPARDLNVVLIFQESTYNKYLSLFSGSDDTQPRLSQYKDSMEVFPNFFSSFAGSINARFATFTGLYPVCDYKSFTSTTIPVKGLFRILHERDYACSMFYSSSFDYTGFGDFLRGRNIDGLYDADSMPGKRTLPPVSWGLREEETLGAIKSQIQDYAAAKKKFFLTYIPAAPHNPFDGTPTEFCKYHLQEMGDFTPLYKNELLYMDSIIASILDQLKASGILDKTLIVITADHGELLGNNKGPIGHGWMLTPELANVPLIIMDPGTPGYRVNPTVGSQVDILPTILDRLNLPLPAGQLYQGASLYSDFASGERRIYLNTFRQFGILEGNRLLMGDRENPSGTNGVAQAFTISNDGARTVFSPIDSTETASMTLFDRFQSGFLRDYGRYCRMMSPTNFVNLVE